MDEQQLVDPDAIEILVDALEVSETDTVLEIGPGTGNITTKLLERAGNVIVVEKNPKYRTVLKGRFGNDPKLDIIINDALFYRFPSLDIIVSNLPYMISEPILHRLFKVQFRKASLIVSSGFAGRVTSMDSKLGFLTQLMFDVENRAEIPSSSYLPPPKVPTSIITLTPREPETSTDSLMQAVFRQEDKKTFNALREALIQIGVAETKRQAKSLIDGFEVSHTILTTPVARLSYDQILALSQIMYSRVS